MILSKQPFLSVLYKNSACNICVLHAVNTSQSQASLAIKNI